jgi:hypothetical protein
VAAIHIAGLLIFDIGDASSYVNRTLIGVNIGETAECGGKQED